MRGRQFLFGCVGIAGLLLLWEIGHRFYGSLVLPSLTETVEALISLIVSGRAAPALMQTAGNAAMGWLAGVAVGIATGSIAGLRDEARFALQPIAVTLLGVPAIAWVVLALLWFGGRWAVVFTIGVAIAPFIFAAAMQGVRRLDGDLAKMARAFRTPTMAMMTDIYGPHMLGYLFPALATTLAMSWKVSIMAELLSGSGGIGDGIAGARARVDTAETMAWVVIVVVALLLIDHLLLRRLQRHMDHWRPEPKGRRS